MTNEPDLGKRLRDCNAYMPDQEELVHQNAALQQENARLKESGMSGLITANAALASERDDLRTELQQVKDNRDQIATHLNEYVAELQQAREEIADERAGRHLLAKATDRINDLEQQLAQARERIAYLEKFEVVPPNELARLRDLP